MLDKEINRYNSVKTGKITPTDRIITLGVLAGATYCVVGVVNSANPIVLAFAGAVILVLVGVKAKRIIDLFF